MAPKSTLPAPVSALIAGIEPAPLVKNAATVGAGFAAAMLGGRLLRQIDAVEGFAAGGIVQDIAVDFAGGLAVDALALLPIYFATRGKDGDDVGPTVLVAKRLVIGTVLGAVVPNAAEQLASFVDRASSFLVGLLGRDAKGLPAPAAPAPALPAVGATGIDPGGIYSMERSPGGGIYGMAAS